MISIALFRSFRTLFTFDVFSVLFSVAFPSCKTQVAMLRVNQVFQWMVEKKLKFSNSLFGFLEKSSSNPVTCMTSVYCARNSTIHSTAVRVCMIFLVRIQFFLSSRFIGGDRLVYQLRESPAQESKHVSSMCFNLWGWKDPRKSPSFANTHTTNN